MGLFSFLFAKKSSFRSTQEAENLRIRFLEDIELFQKVEQSEELRRWNELEERVNNSDFERKRKEIRQMTYKGSECEKTEKRYRSLLKSPKLQSYLFIRDSRERKEAEQVKTTGEYQDYIRLKAIVEASGFDKKKQSDLYEEWKKVIALPAIAALIKFENLKKYRDYCEVQENGLAEEYEKLKACVESEDFRSRQKFLKNKRRYETTEDYRLWQEYENLKKQPEIVRYHELLKDDFFNEWRRWEPVFEDDFKEGRLDETKWITRYYAGERLLNDTYGVGDDVQLYTPANISFQESSVCLNFRKETVTGKYWDRNTGIREKKYEYTSALISSALSFRQCYGRFEAKVRLNHAPVASCFWMLGDKDVPHIEIMNDQADGLRMGRVYARQEELKKEIQFLDKMKLDKEYYIFTFEWTPEKMTWRINDAVVKEETRHIPDVPMYIIFSLGACQNLPDKCLPVKMQIDWVRGYKIKDYRL